MQVVTAISVKRPTRNVNELVALPYARVPTNRELGLGAASPNRRGNQYLFLLTALTLGTCLVSILVTKHVVVQQMRNS